jgi:hypothetical protein
VTDPCRIRKQLVRTSQNPQHIHPISVKRAKAVKDRACSVKAVMAGLDPAMTAMIMTHKKVPAGAREMMGDQ